MFIGKWFDIKEQEPEDGQECLIYTKKNKMFRAEWNKHKGGSPEYNKKGVWHYNNRYYDDNTVKYWTPLPSPPDIVYDKYCFDDDFFGAVINCAVRYACGRQSYMPSLVVGEVRKMIPFLNDKTIGCMERDIREVEKYGGYGDEKIDKSMWLKFLKELQDVMDKRGIERWQ